MYGEREEENELRAHTQNTKGFYTEPYIEIEREREEEKSTRTIATFICCYCGPRQFVCVCVCCDVLNLMINSSHFVSVRY